jgi:Cu-processing system ATP-binding protein
MITVEHLSKSFGSFTAVNDVSFHVPRGEVFALLGPNGGGKTTTLKCFAGLNIPSGGRVRVADIDVRVNPSGAQALVSYLPQRIVFPENLTAREIISFYGTLRGISRDETESSLAHAGFNGSADNYVGTFSGGMTQRLGLAIVAMAQTPVLLLDEPTANLDPEGVKRFREFVISQREAGRTVVFSTHMLAEVEQLADRAAIFVAGRVVAMEEVRVLRSSFESSGTLEDMYLDYVRRPSHET